MGAALRAGTGSRPERRGVCVCPDGLPPRPRRPPARRVARSGTDPVVARAEPGVPALAGRPAPCGTGDRRGRGGAADGDVPARLLARGRGDARRLTAPAQPTGVNGAANTGGPPLGLPSVRAPLVRRGTVTKVPGYPYAGEWTPDLSIPRHLPPLWAADKRPEPHRGRSAPSPEDAEPPMTSNHCHWR